MGGWKGSIELCGLSANEASKKAKKVLRDALQDQKPHSKEELIFLVLRNVDPVLLVRWRMAKARVQHRSNITTKHRTGAKRKEIEMDIAEKIRRAASRIVGEEIGAWKSEGVVRKTLNGLVVWNKK